MSRQGWCCVVSGTGNSRAYLTSSIRRCECRGNILAQGYQGMHSFPGGQVIGAEKRVRAVLFQDRFDKRASEGRPIEPSRAHAA